MNNRIVQLRKNREWTQDEFAEKMGISKNYVSLIENGKKKPSDRLVSDICREFNVNEKWLRTGEGEMKLDDFKDNRYLSNVGKLQRADDETIMRWVNLIAETDPKVLKEVEEFMKKLLEIQED